MQAASRKKLQELQQIIAKMPLEACLATVIPEFGVRWREVSRAVRNNRLPMVPGSVARVLTRHAARSLPQEEVDEIVSRLRLKLVACQERRWYVIDLLDPIQEETSVERIISDLPGRVADALRGRRGGQTKRPEVQIVLFEDLLYMSVQLVTDLKRSGALFVATPVGQPVALVSSLTSGLLKSCVEGLGYARHEYAQLCDVDARSLLRVHSRHMAARADHLAAPPPYNPAPVLTTGGIDYTHKTYDENYVDEVLGPDPPLLTELTIATAKPFFDRSRLTKTIKLTVQLKSEDVAKTLKSWVVKGALNPTSEFFEIFHKVKSNKITFEDDE